MEEHERPSTTDMPDLTAYLCLLEVGLGRSRFALQLKVLVPERSVLLLELQLVHLERVDLVVHDVERRQQMRVLLA